MDGERVRPYPFLVEPLRTLPLVLISLFVAVGAVDVLIAIQPGILQSLRGYWQSNAGGGTASSALAAASLIVGGVAVAATLLAAFIRGARSAPYLCITPVWVCACMLAIARLPVELPLPVPMSAFVAISALLFVGSGVLFETPARLPNLIGVSISILPLTLLSIGYALNPQALANFTGDTILMFFVLALAAAGAPSIAIACRGQGSRVFAGVTGDAREPTGTHMVELLERARLSEERAERAERQLASLSASQHAIAHAPRLVVSDDGDSALMRSSSGGSWYGWGAAALLLAIVIGGYLFAFAPLRAQLANQAQLAQEQINKQAAALASAKADFARQRAELEQQLSAAAPGSATTPPGAPDPSRSGKAGATMSAADAQPGLSDASAEREARAQARLARREEAAAAREAKAAEREANAAAARAVREEERAEKAAEREAKAAERETERAAKAADREATRAARAAEREARAAERAAHASEKPARAAAASADSDDEEDDESEDEPEAKHAAPAPAPKASTKESDSDDPLEGLDGM